MHSKAAAIGRRTPKGSGIPKGFEPQEEWNSKRKRTPKGTVGSHVPEQREGRGALARPLPLLMHAVLVLL